LNKDTKGNSMTQSRHFFLPILFFATSLLFATRLALAQDTPTPILPLSDFLARVQSYPTVQASLAAVQAAEARLEQVYSPLSVSADTALTASPDPDSQGLTLTTEDLMRQREIELEQARLAYRETLVAAEVSALTTELSTRLSQESLALAEQGVTVASQNLVATRLRFDQGIATVQDLRTAELGEREAQAALLNAQVSSDLAASGLRTLVGEVRLAELPELPVPQGEALSVLRARLAVELAKIALYGVQRDVYPVARASYKLDIQDTSAVSVSVASDTLEPTLQYSYDSKGFDNPENQFQIGVNMSLSPGTFRAIEAAQRNLESAEATLQARATEAAQELARLQSVQAEAERSLELARVAFENAQGTFAEVQERENLGLSLPLETQRASLAVTQAGLELQTALLDAQQARFAFYSFYGQPISEVQP
jgi:outer membrane protein